MKRLILILASTLWMIPVSAQWITALSVQPANPTSADTVRVIASVSFPSGDCSEKTKFLNVFGSQIQASALHCLGMLTFICSTSDTFEVGLLPAGTYTFSMQLDAGSLPSPCTPGIVPGSQDSVTIVVTPASSVPEVPKGAIFSIFPVPANGVLNILLHDQPEPGCYYEITDAMGRVAVSHRMDARQAKADLTSLASGTYLIRILSPGRKPAEEKFTLIR